MFVCLFVLLLKAPLEMLERDIKKAEKTKKRSKAEFYKHVLFGPSVISSMCVFPNTI